MQRTGAAPGTDRDLMALDWLSKVTLKFASLEVDAKAAHPRDGDDAPRSKSGRAASAAGPSRRRSTGARPPCPTPKAKANSSGQGGTLSRSRSLSRSRPRSRSRSLRVSSSASSLAAAVLVGEGALGEEGCACPEQPYQELVDEWDASCTYKPMVPLACLIALAVRDSRPQKLTVTQISAWVRAKFAFYRRKEHASRLKSTLRQHLSSASNTWFVRINRQKGEPGKGCFWGICPDAAPDVASAVTQRRTGPAGPAGDTTGGSRRPRHTSPSDPFLSGGDEAAAAGSSSRSSKRRRHSFDASASLHEISAAAAADGRPHGGPGVALSFRRRRSLGNMAAAPSHRRRSASFAGSLPTSLAAPFLSGEPPAPTPPDSDVFLFDELTRGRANSTSSVTSTGESDGSSDISDPYLDLFGSLAADTADTLLPGMDFDAFGAVGLPFGTAAPAPAMPAGSLLDMVGECAPPTFLDAPGTAAAPVHPLTLVDAAAPAAWPAAPDQLLLDDHAWPALPFDLPLSA